MPVPEFKFVNATGIQLPADSWFMPNSIQVSAVNASIFIQLKFENSSLGYVFITKFGLTPRLNDTFKDIDDVAFFCPSRKNDFE